MTVMASKHDVIVIGSGLGGLATAACLAASGRSVLVLEQHEMLGGCSQVFRRKKQWEFDVGVHYVGGCAPGCDGLIATVLRGLGVEDRIAWSRMDDDGMDTVSFPDHAFRVPTSWQGLADNLAQVYPADAAGLRGCVAELQRVGESFDRINDVPHSVRAVLPLAKRPREAFAIGRGLEEPIARMFDRHQLTPPARAACLSLIHLHNTPPDRTPALLIAALLQHYFKFGAYFPTQGGQVLAANLTEVIQSHGGTVRTKARVASIDVAGGRVTGVTLDDGEQLRADVVVSNADAHRTFLDLVGPEHLRRRTVERIRRFRRPHSIFSLYLAADIDISRSRPATNYISHGRYDMQRTFELMDRGAWDPDAWFAISSPTLKTGGVRHFGAPGHSTIEAFTTVPDAPAFWGGGDPYRDRDYTDTPAYLERKAEIEERMLERTLEILPELRGHVVWQESATPLTHERYTLSRMPYGPENSKDQIGPGRRLPVTTDVGGLYLAGASTVFLYGVAFTLRGGVGVASRIVGRDLMKAFHAGEVIADPRALPEHGADWDPFLVCRRHAVKKRRRERVAAVPAAG
jgi:ferredoxin--NADP+ reductase